jgi:shikimate kinase
MPHDFRMAASQALKHVLAREDSCNCVIALPPSGLMGGYWKVVNRTQDATIVVLQDAPENIVKRCTFYDIDSRPIQKNLTDREKILYIRDIKLDITYYKRSFQRAHVLVDIAGCDPDEASRKVKAALTPAQLTNRSNTPEQPLGRRPLEPSVQLFLPLTDEAGQSSALGASHHIVQSQAMAVGGCIPARQPRKRPTPPPPAPAANRGVSANSASQHEIVAHKN